MVKISCNEMNSSGIEMALMRIVGSIFVALLGLQLAIPRHVRAQEKQIIQDMTPAAVQLGEDPELSLGEVMWRSAIRALEEHSITIQTTSKEKRLIITEFVSLDPNVVSKVVILNEQDQGVKWARAEYRYLIGIGVRSDNAQPDEKKERILVKAEIWAWEQGSIPTSEAKRALQSNNTLEREFLEAFTSGLGRLEEPATARAQVDPDRGFARGPKDAPVAIVEFSDYQCPYCRAALGTIHEILARYPEKVKWVFRDFPIESLHPMAPKAHEAARCAAVQGKFWEYHDLLFERSPRHSLEELKQYAQELTLDSSAFYDCLESGRHQADVVSDVQEGIRLGVSGTPTFYVNGWMLTGARPFTVFQKLIDSELESNSRE